MKIQDIAIIGGALALLGLTSKKSEAVAAGFNDNVSNIEPAVNYTNYASPSSLAAIVEKACLEIGGRTATNYAIQQRIKLFQGYIDEAIRRGYNYTTDGYSIIIRNKDGVLYRVWSVRPIEVDGQIIPKSGAVYTYHNKFIESRFK